MSGVKSLNLNIEGMDPVIIHMILAKNGNKREFAIVIVNGNENERYTVQKSWAILLSIFMKFANTYGDIKITQEILEYLKERTCKETKKMFPLYSKKIARKSLDELLNTLFAAARGDLILENKRVVFLDNVENLAGPVSMDLLVSSIKKDGVWNCNQECRKCYNDQDFLARMEEMSTAEWIEVIEKIWDEAYVSQINFAGAEPTMREDLIALIKVARNFFTRLYTNGVTLSNKNYCKQLAEAKLDEVRITLYSANPEFHNKMVGIPDGFIKTIGGIKNSLEVGIKVCVYTPIVCDNQDYVETLKFLHDLGIKNVICSGEITAENGNSNEKELTLRGLEKILINAARYCEENEMKIVFSSPGLISKRFFQKNNLEVPYCRTCISNMAIAPNGEVVPCASWLDRNISLGNILDVPWEKIWNSFKVRILKSQVIGNPLVCRRKMF